MTDVGTLEDKSSTSTSYEGAQAGAAADRRCRHDTIVTEGAVGLRREHPDVRRPEVRRHRDGRLPPRRRDTAKAAKANPDIQFVGVDQGICVDETGVPEPTFACKGDAKTLLPNYQGLVFREDQAGYLAGIVAGSRHASRASSAPSAGPTSRPSSTTSSGYENGAKSVNPDVKVAPTSRPRPLEGASTTRARARPSRSSSSDQKADVLFQVAGLTGDGVLEAVCAGLASAASAWTSTRP